MQGKRKATEVDIYPGTDHADPAKSPHKRRRKTKDERRRELDDDTWSLDVDATKGVQCKGCTKWIKLGRKFEVKNWELHRSKCPRITNEVRVRVSGIKRIVTETPVSSSNCVIILKQI